MTEHPWSPVHIRNSGVSLKEEVGEIGQPKRISGRNWSASKNKWEKLVSLKEVEEIGQPQRRSRRNWSASKKKWEKLFP